MTQQQTQDKIKANTLNQKPNIRAQPSITRCQTPDRRRETIWGAKIAFWQRRGWKSWNCERHRGEKHKKKWTPWRVGVLFLIFWTPLMKYEHFRFREKYIFHCTILLVSQKVLAKYMMKFEWLFRRIETTLLYLSPNSSRRELQPETWGPAPALYSYVAKRLSLYFIWKCI